MTGAERARPRGAKNAPLLDPTLGEMWQRALKAEAALRETREALRQVEKVGVWLRSVAAGREADVGLFSSPAVQEAMQREARSLRMAADDLEAALARAGEQT